MSETQGLHNLVAPRGARKKQKRVGRGESSGHGKTSGRGNKGQKARKSGNVRPGFEGGQMRLARRQPKRGFKNIFARAVTVVNVGRLADAFEAGATIDPAHLIMAGILSKVDDRVKVLAEGDIKHALHLKVHAISAAAQKKIEAAGGSVQVLGDQTAV
jgi:large subunit ribosomal protein L15